MEDWAEIRRLHRAEGMPVRAIARRLGMGLIARRRSGLWIFVAAWWQRVSAGSDMDGRQEPADIGIRRQSAPCPAQASAGRRGDELDHGSTPGQIDASVRNCAVVVIVAKHELNPAESGAVRRSYSRARCRGGLLMRS